MRWHCRVALAYRERPVLVVRYDALLANPHAEFTRLLQFVTGSARAPTAEKLARVLSQGQVRHASATNELRGAFPVYATDGRFATPAAVGAIADALRSTLPLGLWTNALAASQSNETLLGPMGANPLYHWKTERPW